METTQTESAEVTQTGQEQTQNESELTQTGQEQVPEGQVPEQKSYGLKIDGKEISVPESDFRDYFQKQGIDLPEVLDEKTEKFLVKALQKDLASDNKFRSASYKAQEVAKKETAMQQFFQSLKENPFETLINSGIDIFPHMEQQFSEFLRLQQMDDAEREKELLKIERDHLIKENETRAEQEKRIRYEQQRQEEAGRILTEVNNAINRVGIPETPQNVSRIIGYMTADPSLDMTFEEAAMLVLEDIKADMKAFSSKNDPKFLSEILGEENLRKAFGSEAAKLKKPGEKPAQITRPAGSQVQSGPRALTEREAELEIMKRLGRA